MPNFVWYSGATDVTGQAIAEALGITGTKTRPAWVSGDNVICWGAKTEADINVPNGVRILNHPNAIRKNRNKIQTLELMKNTRSLSNCIAPFFSLNAVDELLNRDRAEFPLIGRRSHHQGGKGFWLCLTKAQVRKAISAGAEYFQKYIDIDKEYRIHIINGDVVHAVQKVENDAENSWISQHRELINNAAEGKDLDLDDETISFVLGKLVKQQTLPDYVIRSNKRGWKFSTVNNPPAALRDVAIRAVAAVGLDFGAVDCALDVNNAAYIIEINTGPGLQGAALDKYRACLRQWIDTAIRPAPNVAKAGAAVKAKRAVGAELANGAANDADDNDGLALVMRNVRNNDEARAVIDELMARKRR